MAWRSRDGASGERGRTAPRVAGVGSRQHAAREPGPTLERPDRPLEGGQRVRRARRVVPAGRRERRARSPALVCTDQPDQGTAAAATPSCRHPRGVWSRLRTVSSDRSSSAASYDVVAPAAADSRARRGHTRPVCASVRVPPGVAQDPLRPVPGHRAAHGLGDDETDSRRWSASRFSLSKAGHPAVDHDQPSARACSARSTDGGGEVRGRPEPMTGGKHAALSRAVSGGQFGAALRRREARIARPARVRIRRRKPWVLARRRLFGWKVRLLTRCLRCCQARGRGLACEWLKRVGRARFGRHRNPGPDHDRRRSGASRAGESARKQALSTIREPHRQGQTRAPSHRGSYATVSPSRPG